MSRVAEILTQFNSLIHVYITTQRAKCCANGTKLVTKIYIIRGGCTSSYFFFSSFFPSYNIISLSFSFAVTISTIPPHSSPLPCLFTSLRFARHIHKIQFLYIHNKHSNVCAALSIHFVADIRVNVYVYYI